MERNLKRLKVIKDYGATQIFLLKDLESGLYMAEKRLAVGIDVQKKLFLNECKMHAFFKHRYIIDFIGRQDELSFLMEYAPNGNLATFLERKPDRGIIHKILTQLLKGLSYLHKLGYVHNDIKLSNILLDEDNRTKISDFAFTGKIGENTFQDFPDYFMVGTDKLHNFALKDNPINQIKNDIHATGILMYQLYTSSTNFDKVEPEKIVDENIRCIVKKCIQFEYENMEQILDDLSRATRTPTSEFKIAKIKGKGCQ